jgi:NAD(P)-dependent dehydrogenase (short-subunit alcohol dehydrogenase family)
VTGGTSGLGLAIAERFLAEGASIVVTGRDEALGAQALSTSAAPLVARHGSVVLTLPIRDEVEASVELTVDHLGRIDILVNNAGISLDARLLDTPIADFERVMAVNVRGPFLYARACYPHLATHAGSMIHISSDAGVTGEPEIGAYSVSKASVIMLSNMLALDGGRNGVRSNCICPGDIEPGMRHSASPGGEEGWPYDSSEWHTPPIGRIGRAKDVADAAVFFASAESSFCNGSVLPVDGGMRAGILRD